MKKDYYLVLHLNSNASGDEVRSAYRRLAREVHPDTSGADSERFLELQEAYEVLGDPVQRARYDHQTQEIPVRHGWFRESFDPSLDLRREAEPLVPNEEADWSNRISLLRSFGTTNPSADELFDRLWSNFTLSTRPKAERAENLIVDVPLSAQDALTGGTVEILVPAQLVCPRCSGLGHVMGYECWHCDGHGILTGEYPIRAPYPGGLQHDYVIQMPLTQAGINNFYLTVRFRPV
jgi:molecular chaperone DnaJ